MNYYIFSYGTLAHKEVAEVTGKTLVFIPAVLTGYKRNFRVAVKFSGFSAVGIEKDKETETLGMLVQIPESELSKFDEREDDYDRIEITGQGLSLLSGEPVPEGRFYLYVPKNPQPPTEDSPLAQSYIDVVLTPFLVLDPKWISEVIRTMGDLDRPWINDRRIPRYSRYPQSMDSEAIDDFLKRIVPEKFTERRDAEDLRIKPELLNSIFSTIRFFDLFEFPLNAEEVMEHLYKYPKALHIKELRAVLAYLVDAGQLNEIKGYFVLPGRESNVEIRNTRKFIAEKFWNRTKLYGQYMRTVPFTRMIAVCNNLAYDNPSDQSDIDLFIVVKPGRMWLARFLITLILQFYGVRRHGNKIAGRFCLSFFVTEDKVDMKQFELGDEDPYLAYWTKNLRPIFGENAYQNFCNRNRDWLRGYGLKFDDSRKKHMYLYKDSKTKKFAEWLLGGFIGTQLENLLKATLKRKTLNSMRSLGPEANVIVTDEVLKFHNHDRRQEFLDRWKQREH